MEVVDEDLDTIAATFQTSVLDDVADSLDESCRCERVKISERVHSDSRNLRRIATIQPRSQASMFGQGMCYELVHAHHAVCEAAIPCHLVVGEVLLGLISMDLQQLRQVVLLDLDLRGSTRFQCSGRMEVGVGHDGFLFRIAA